MFRDDWIIVLFARLALLIQTIDKADSRRRPRAPLHSGSCTLATSASKLFTFFCRRLLSIIRNIVGDNGPAVNAFSLAVKRTRDSDSTKGNTWK